MRGIAILMVVFYHVFCYNAGNSLPWTGWFQNFKAPPSQYYLWFYPMSFGWAGVALFFVLSGFCIHFSFLRSKNFTIRNFFWRRFCRIYPAYLAALLVFTIFCEPEIWSAFGARQIFSHLALLHNLRESWFFGINPSFWSIAVEFQLYLLYPILLFLRSKIGMNKSLILVFSLGMLWRLFAVSYYGLPKQSVTSVFTFPIMTWFDWILGAYVAENFAQGQRSFSKSWLWLIVLTPLFLTSTLFKPTIIFSFSLAAAVSAVVLDRALHHGWRDRGFPASLAFIGGVSYSLYLWHQPVLYLFELRMKPLLGSFFAIGTYLLFIILASWLSYLLVERSGIRFGNWFWSKLPNREGKKGWQN